MIEQAKQRLSISIHVPARGATRCRHFINSFLPNFNPRSREGSDLNHTTAPAILVISIHAPARGATHLIKNSYDSVRNFNPRSREGSDRKVPGASGILDISIHAPARGATTIYNVEQLGLKFQSTLPRGERHQPSAQNVNRKMRISIHAPARGATRSACCRHTSLPISIHAPARGAT